MTRHELAKQVLLAEILKIRLRDVVPSDFQLIARDSVLDLSYQGTSERRIYLDLWNKTSTEQEDIGSIVSSVLNNVQDAIVRATREIWPMGQETNDLPLPDRSWRGQTLHIWFGDEHNPVLRLEPIHLSELGT